MMRGSTKREHIHIAMSAAARLASALDARLAKATAMAAPRPLRVDLCASETNVEALFLRRSFITR